MIALIRNNSTESRTESTDGQFLAMLPSIRRQAAIAFRNMLAEAREESIQEVICRAYSAYVQMARRGKAAIAYPTPLACFAIRQVRAGRRVGCPQNSGDVMSPVAHRGHVLKIERLDRRNDRTGDWDQLLVEDRKAGPAETAAARIDLRAWFAMLPRRYRRIAGALAVGGKTSDVARQFGLTPGRISQLRSSFHAHWEHFQGCNLMADDMR
jgi:hypothetical protein